MAEELQRYKNILAREHQEFKEQMEGEVSTILPFQIEKKVVSEPGVTEYCSKFCKCFFF